jgi:KTSC domain
MEKVSSSSLWAAGYDYGTGELYVEFNNGMLYRYSGVPVAIYQGLMTADSCGRYLNACVRDVFAYERVG